MLQDNVARLPRQDDNYTVQAAEGHADLVSVVVNGTRTFIGYRPLLTVNWYTYAGVGKDKGQWDGSDYVDVEELFDMVSIAKVMTGGKWPPVDNTALRTMELSFVSITGSKADVLEFRDKHVGRVQQCNLVLRKWPGSKGPVVTFNCQMMTSEGDVVAYNTAIGQRTLLYPQFLLAGINWDQ